jgi:hypothetical protein
MLSQKSERMTQVASKGVFQAGLVAGEGGGQTRVGEVDL